MGFINKLKDFFYDEEEIEEEPVVPKKKEQPRVKIEKEEPKEKEITERELFKSERTFNFPIDMDEEPDFTPISKSSKQSRVDNNKKENLNQRDSYRIQESNGSRINKRTQNAYSYVQKKEEKKFKPTPIISPVYGVLQKKEEAKVSTKKTEVVKKIDYDTVREKAYGPIKKESEENKGLFFNLVDDNNQNNDIDDDVKITYNDVDYGDENTDLDVDVPKIIRKKENQVVDNDKEEDSIMSDSNEQDLFNLIDNMYSSEDDEEE